MTSSPESAPPVVAVFAPCSLVTVSMEIVDALAEVHFNAGGQGVQVARTAAALGADPVLCTACGGEPGRVFRLLLAEEPGIARWVSAGLTQVDLHVRRDGHRHDLLRTWPTPLDRRAVEVLYRTTVTAASSAAACVLTDGPAGSKVPAEVFQRLAADLRAIGVPVVADASGAALSQAAAGGATVVKTSDLELLADRRVADLSRRSVVTAMRALRDAGAGRVVVARDDGTALALAEGDLVEVRGPQMRSPEPPGSGDAITASLAVSLARDQPLEAGPAQRVCRRRDGREPVRARSAGHRTGDPREPGDGHLDPGVGLTRPTPRPGSCGRRCTLIASGVQARLDDSGG